MLEGGGTVDAFFALFAFDRLLWFTLERLTACSVGQSGIISDKDGLRLPGSPGLSLGVGSLHDDGVDGEQNIKREGGKSPVSTLDTHTHTKITTHFFNTSFVSASCSLQGALCPSSS